ncbi:MAG: phosphoglycerate kinase [Oscillospiraceae bacterium]|jgi:3-phosphoglycerate kinase|nr:phosphoglycerate kinase [Oscillospiraceae bacterium]
MNYSKLTVRDVDVSGKRVLYRGDFNVPLDKATGEITDDGRITASMPTLRYLLDAGARVVACSHLGRPKGRPNPAMSLEPVRARLSELLGQEIKMSGECAGDEARAIADGLAPGELMMLENLRFCPEEEANDAGFAKTLADFADIYVSDAFGTVHRAHASTAGVAKYLPAVAGFLLAKELEVIGGALTSPARPFVAVLGGSKISDKMGVITNLLNVADSIIIGGGMAYTFIKATGGRIGASMLEPDRLDFARETWESAAKSGKRLLLPTDVIAAASIDDAEGTVLPARELPDDRMGLDIGPDTRARFVSEIAGAGTVIWNGPMGVFENPAFEAGTRALAEALALSDCASIIGGGDSAAAVRKFGLEDRMTHVSTGGGATLEFLEGINLPGIDCLLDKK